MKRFLIIFGVITCLVGLYLFNHPLATVANVAWMGALVLFFNGCSSLITYFQASKTYRRPWRLIQGMISLIFGIVLLSSSAFSLSATIVSLVAYWLLFLGGSRLMAAYTYYKAVFPDSRREFVSALLTVLAALLLLFNPIFSAAVIGYFVALVFLIFGAGLLWSGLNL